VAGAVRAAGDGFRDGAAKRHANNSAGAARTIHGLAKLLAELLTLE
jgi:hypothetical protein